MTPKFDAAIARLLDNEGRYTRGIGDPGGETKFGISKRSYPKLDIKNLTREQAIGIYLADFWTPIDGENQPVGVGFQMLDFAVNSGVVTALKALQRAIGVQDDGVFGPVSYAALQAQSSTDTIMLLLAERIDLMTSLRNWQTAGIGWMRRIGKDLRYGAADT